MVSQTGTENSQHIGNKTISVVSQNHHILVAHKEILSVLK